MVEAGSGTASGDRIVRPARVCGLVLCGGASTRMGRDKAQVCVGQVTLLARAVAIVSAVADDVRLATGSEPRYAAMGLRLCLDRFQDGGPLAGLEAGLSDCAADPAVDLVVVLAVDMPEVEPRLLAALVRRARERRLDVALLDSETGLEPLCSAWSTRMAHATRRTLEAGRRKVTATFDEPLEDGRLPRVESFTPRELVGPTPKADIACNVNTPEDLERLRARVVGARGMA